MTPDQIRAAAAARKSAAERKSSADNTDLMGLLRKSPAGQGQTMPAQEKVNFSDPVQGDPTAMTAIADNVVGLDNGVMSPGEKLGTALNAGGESMTLGIVGDEAAAAFDAAIGNGTYEDRLQFYRDNQDQLREDNPMLSFAAEVAPALLPGLGGAKLLSGLTSKLGHSGAGAALGALSGLIYGAAEGEGGAGSRAINAGATAALGGIVGAAAPKIMDVAKNVPKRVTRAFARSQERPTIQNLKQAKTLAYRAVEESGETFSGDEMSNLYETIAGTFDDNNYVEEVDNASRAVLKILERRQGKDTTISQLDSLRQNMWKRYASAKDQPQILDAIKAVDDLIDQKSGASELMDVARAANSRFAKSQLLDDAFRKAEDQTAGAGSGGNILNKYRQAVTNIINNPNKARWFNDEEIGMMREFVRGSMSENTMRKIGKLSPDGNGLMMALHVIGGVASSGATLPLMAVGAGAKAAADRSATRGVNAIQQRLAGVPAQATPRITAGQMGAITGSTPLSEDVVDRTRAALRR